VGKNTDGAQRLKEIVKAAKNPAQLPTILAIIGPDSVRVERAAEFVLSAMVPDRLSHSGTVTRVGAASISTSKLELDLRNASLFHPLRFLLITSCQDLKVADNQSMANWGSALPDSSKVILLGEKLLKTSPLGRFLVKEDALIELEEMKGIELRKWVERECARENIKFESDQVIEELLSVTNNSPNAIAKAIELLSIYLDGDPASVEHVRTLLTGSAEMSDYALVDSVLACKEADSQSLLRQLLRNGSNPFLILSALSRSWNQAHQVAALARAGLRAPDIKAATGFSPWLISKYLATSSSMSENRGRAGLRNLLFADSRLKGRSAGPEPVLSELTWQLSRRGPAQRGT